MSQRIGHFSVALFAKINVSARNGASKMAKPILVIGNKNYSSWSLRPYMALAMADIDFDIQLVKFGETELGRLAFSKAVK